MSRPKDPDDLSRMSTGELVRDVADDVRLLVRKELELARVDLTEGLLGKLKGLGIAALAVVAVLPGLFFLVIALALWIPGSPAVGFAVIGGALVVVAGCGVGFGIWKFKRSRGPAQTIESLKEDARWARGHLTR